jgi:hypothetical protein
VESHDIDELRELTRMMSSIFSIEVAARLDRAPNLLPILKSAIVDQPQAAGLHQKWQLYKRATEALLGNLGAIERGCWDYFDDDARAKKDYEQWVNGMVTEEGARTTPSGDDPYRGGPRYMTFTMAFLLVNGSHADLALRRICEIPEPLLWHRATFHRILSNLGVLNFASIQSDVAYLIPRDPGWGLTHDDLVQPKFAYLRPLQ